MAETKANTGVNTKDLGSIGKKANDSKVVETPTYRDVTITSERHNTIFENKLYSSTSNVNGSFWMRDRLNLLNGNVAYEFNTYRTWSPFAILVQPVVNGTGEANTSFYEYMSSGGLHIDESTGYAVKSEKDDLIYPTAGGKAYPGRKSLFNPFTAVQDTNMERMFANAPLLDSPETREVIKGRNDCSIKALIDATEAGEMGRATYTWADFMYCKYLGKVSNNYMITLRRFSTPPGDHISVVDADIEHNAHLPDIGRMITWMGTPGNDMSSILKYNVKIPYKQFDAKIEEVEDQTDSKTGLMTNLMNAAQSDNQQLIREGVSGGAQIELLKGALGAVPGIGKLADVALSSDTLDNTWRRNYDTQKSYGPLDVITSTYQRRGANDGGLEFEQTINLQFDYEMRWYDGVNGKSAMLDLLSNVLQTCYTTGKFWGGAYKFLGGSQSNIYANLPMFAHKYNFGGKEKKAGYRDFGTDVAESLNGLAASTTGEENNQTRQQTVGDTLRSTVSQAADAVKSLLQQGPGMIASLFYGGLLNKLGRPQIFAINSLLTDAPTGLWHLTIGNPKAPIMSMGNMFIDSCEIEHYGPLGIDDFPTGLLVKVTLKHAKPRDNSAIERMYLHGDYRIYTPMGSEYEKMYKGAALMKSRTVYRQSILDETGAAQTPQVIEAYNLTNDANTPNKEGGYAYDGTSTIYNNASWFEEGETGTAKDINYLMRYFGSSRDRDTIMFASMEALFGASPQKSYKEEQDLRVSAEKALKEKEKVDVQAEKNRRLKEYLTSQGIEQENTSYDNASKEIGYEYDKQGYNIKVQVDEEYNLKYYAKTRADGNIWKEITKDDFSNLYKQSKEGNTEGAYKEIKNLSK